MRVQIQVLSPEEKKLIHEETMRILEEVGIKFPSERALDILERGGAKIDREKQIAYISRQMVDDALRAAPKEITLVGRDTANDFRMPSSFTGYHMDGCGMNMIDLETGERRPSVLKDLVDAARVFDETDLGYVYWPPVSPLDVPAGARSIAATAAGLINCGKHIQDEMKTAAEIPYVMELIKAVLGGDKLSAGRDVYSVVYCTVSPLCHDKDMLEANIELCKYKVPIVALPMPAVLTTGPASLYSNVALSSAETLSALVMFELTEPGVPLIYASSIGIASPRSGLFQFGMPETVVQLAAIVEMGKYYNLPTMISGCATDAKRYGGQTMMEKMATTLPLVMTKPDTFVGYGMYECSTTLSLSQIIIDNMVAGYCKKIHEGIDISQETDFFEDVKSVGQGGHFLKQKSTRMAVRSGAFYASDLLDKGSYDEWLSLGSRDLDDIAREKARQILASEQKSPLPRDTEKILLEIVEEAAAKLAE
ncbi:MAG TPA: trimethylamine methyltransferase family protein [Anaerovoracaceae bacterium]|nr:trimethylamine methyltransferase family protein [Anaerovoracaceae bacterium]